MCPALMLLAEQMRGYLAECDKGVRWNDKRPVGASCQFS